MIKYSDLKIFCNLFSVKFSTKTKYLMFDLINVIVFVEIYTHSEFETRDIQFCFNITE